MSKFLQYINENKQFSIKLNKKEIERLKKLANEISKDMGTNPDKEFKRVMVEFKKELNKNELAKFSKLSKGKSQTFSSLKSLGIDVNKLEQEFDKLGYRSVVSRTAGINQIYFEPKKARDIAVDQVITKLEKEL